MALSPDVSDEIMEAMRKRFWLDQPPYMQYIRWITQLFKGDMGHSFLWHAPVSWVIKQRVSQQLAAHSGFFDCSLGFSNPHWHSFGC